MADRYEYIPIRKDQKESLEKIGDDFKNTHGIAKINMQQVIDKLINMWETSDGNVRPKDS